MSRQHSKLAGIVNKYEASARTAFDDAKTAAAALKVADAAAAAASGTGGGTGAAKPGASVAGSAAPPAATSAAEEKRPAAAPAAAPVAPSGGGVATAEKKPGQLAVGQQTSVESKEQGGVSKRVYWVRRSLCRAALLCRSALP
jgi:hypothetical protein